MMNVEEEVERTTVAKRNWLCGLLSPIVCRHSCLCVFVFCLSHVAWGGELSGSPGSIVDTSRGNELEGGRKLNANQTCLDDQAFVDADGYTCLGWVGYNCTITNFVFYGYTGVQGQDIIDECPVSCNVCDEVRDGDRNKWK